MSAISSSHDRSHQTAGSPFPRGAIWDGKGVNFSLFSENSESAELCLFDASGGNERRIRIRERTNGAWHIYLPGVGPGQMYGYRVDGPFAPQSGQRFNSNKLLLDPYAKAIGRPLTWADELFGYHLGDAAGDLSFDDRDSAPFAPLGMVVDPAFDWSGERRPSQAAHETIIYEAHVRGMSRLHPGVPEDLRGTYAGMASEPIVEHLQRLGVTALELMPVHYFFRIGISSTRGCAITGGTTLWASSPSSPAMPRIRKIPTPSSASSSRWSRRCTMPASR